jgi:hypothetical protein
MTRIFPFIGTLANFSLMSSNFLVRNVSYLPIENFAQTSTLLICIGRCPFRISEGISAMLTALFNDFLNSLQLNAKTVPWIRAWLLSSIPFPIRYWLPFKYSQLHSLKLLPALLIFLNFF